MPLSKLLGEARSPLLLRRALPHSLSRVQIQHTVFEFNKVVRLRV